MDLHSSNPSNSGGRYLLFPPSKATFQGVKPGIEPRRGRLFSSQPSCLSSIVNNIPSPTRDGVISKVWVTIDLVRNTDCVNVCYSHYSSPPFRFIVEGEDFYIHSGLVSRLSKPLDCLINGNMIEKRQGWAKLEDISASNFERFVEWTYKGYYTAPPYSLDACIEERPEDFLYAIGNLNSDDEDRTWKRIQTRKAKLKKEKSCEKSYKSARKYTLKAWRADEEAQTSLANKLKEEFVSRKPRALRSVIDIPPPRPNQHQSEIYTDIFLCHAQLYVFAEEKDIQALKQLALENLHATLAIFTLYPRRTGDVLSLLHYVYANTPEKSATPDEMRSLLNQFVTFEMDTLIQDPEFKNVLLDDGGPLLEEFLNMVSKRISMMPRYF